MEYRDIQSFNFGTGNILKNSFWDTGHCLLHKQTSTVLNKRCNSDSKMLLDMHESKHLNVDHVTTNVTKKLKADSM